MNFPMGKHRLAMSTIELNIRKQVGVARVQSEEEVYGVLKKEVDAANVNLKIGWCYWCTT